MPFGAKHAPFIWTPEAKKNSRKFNHSPVLIGLQRSAKNYKITNPGTAQVRPRLFAVAA
jgi:hypothetical protein